MSVGDGRDRGEGSSRAKRVCVVIPIFVCSLQARFTPGVWAPQSSLELVLRMMPGLRYKSLASSLRPGSFQLRWNWHVFIFSKQSLNRDYQHVMFMLMIFALFLFFLCTCSEAWIWNVKSWSKVPRGKKIKLTKCLKKNIFCLHIFFVFDWGNHLQLDI